jgi:hypothetical protein
MHGDSDADFYSLPGEGILCFRLLYIFIVSTRKSVDRKHRPHPISATVTGPAYRMVG